MYKAVKKVINIKITSVSQNEIKRLACRIKCLLKINLSLNRTIVAHKKRIIYGAI